MKRFLSGNDDRIDADEQRNTFGKTPSRQMVMGGALLQNP
jgi:hypothetical protein